MTGRAATRIAIRRRVVDVLNTSEGFASDDILATYSHPGDEVTPEAVFFGNIDGSQETVSFGVDTGGQRDTWVLKGCVSVSGAFETDEDADERCAEIFDDLSLTLTTRPRLGEDMGSLLIGIGAVTGPHAVQFDTPTSEVIFNLEFQARINC